MHFSPPAAVLVLPPEVKTATNVVRHAQASQAWIDITMDDTSFHLVIRDDRGGL